jgi:23S rRNA (pseudouridine1915-N3)-methyltransferase
VRLLVAAVGKPRDRHLAAAIEEYESRAARYWPLVVAEVREASGRGVSASDVRRREGERLVERLPVGALVIACDERGDRLSSSEFAALLTSTRDAARDVAFVVGGAYGLD